MKSVIVTGAHGFLGRHLAKSCAAQGVKVHGIGHGAWQEDEWATWGLSTWLKADVTCENLLKVSEKLNADIEAIFHCAGGSSVGISVEFPEQDFAQTVKTTEDVLEFVKKYSPQTSVALPSSGAVYGKTVGAVLESTLLNPVSPYGRHKKMAEDICISNSLTAGVKVSIVRFFSIYGPGLKKQLLYDACQKITQGSHQFFGTGNETRDWIYIDDAVDLFIKAANKASSPALIVNAGTGVATTVKDVLSEIYNNLKITGEPLFKRVDKPGDPPHFQADVTLAHKLDWLPKTVWQLGIAHYCQWFRSQS
jgi:UDP-glucose 4-epimerase